MKHALCLLIAFALGCTSGAAPPREPVRMAPSAFMEDGELLASCRIENPEAVPDCHPDSGPSSPALDIGFSAYSWKEYRTAIDTFTRAIDGWYGDNGCMRQKALYTRAKAYYRLGAYRKSFDDLVRFVQAGPKPGYRAATEKWLLALRKHLPTSAVDACLVRYDASSSSI